MNRKRDYKMLFEAIRDLSFLLNTDGTIRDINPSGLSILKYEPAERESFQGRQVTDFIFIDDCELIDDIFQGFDKNIVNAEVSLRMVCKNKELVPVKGSFSLVHENNTPFAAAILAVDRERLLKWLDHRNQMVVKAAREARRELEQEIRGFLENNPDFPYSKN